MVSGGSGTRWGRGRRRDASGVRDAVRALVESERCDEWLTEVPADVLVRLAAPLEMLTFHYHLDPPSDRHLLRAVRVACEAMEDHLDECPADLAGAFRRLRTALATEIGPTRREPA